MVETLHPFGNESLFYPKQNLTLTGGSPVTVSRYSAEYYGGYSYSYAIPVYAYYENGTQVEIVSGIEGKMDGLNISIRGYPIDMWIAIASPLPVNRRAG